MDGTYGLTITHGPPLYFQVECPDCEVKDKRVTRLEAENRLLEEDFAAVMGDYLHEMLLVIEAEAALAERDRESTALLDAIFQTIDAEDAEEIVAEAFPKGGPAWVLAWYQDHPNEEELRARAEEGSTP